MGFKKRDILPLWQQPGAENDAAMVLAIIRDNDRRIPGRATAYSELCIRCDISQQRVELAILRILRTTGGIEYASSSTFILKRPRSSVAEHVLGKDGVASSTLAGGSNG